MLSAFLIGGVALFLMSAAYAAWHSLGTQPSSTFHMDHASDSKETAP